MQWMLQLLLLTLCLCFNDAQAAVNHAKAQIEWIRQNGGFFSPKIEFQLLNKEDPESPMGIFALGDIKKHETIMIIPHDCLVTSEGSLETCDTAWNLVKQRRLGAASHFAPYVNYVFDPKHKGNLPSSWSNKGKELIETIIGNELPPYEVTGISFHDECGGRGDPLLEEAYLTVVRRSWDDIMIPVFDMINHRNGHWNNVDSNSAHDGNDIFVFSTRNIEKDEQLYLSYNEGADCDYALTYVLPHILKDYGFVEQYPRRWRFDTKDGTALVFELDQDPDTNELELTWLSGKPKDYQIKFLRGHYLRLQNLKDYVDETTKDLESSYERDVSLEYYQALMTALDYALWYSDEETEECSADADTCTSREYDELDTLPEEKEFNDDICDYDHTRIDIHGSQYDSSSDLTESHYQDIEFHFSEELKDTCLYMNNHLHVCTSFRPHYHEVLVHYPARFVDEVKRVAFIGGGDNMIVHEILKYPSLELVVGLELDQKVVRSSFKNFGTQPHFDNDKLQWWFGDGSKSLLLLPEEYYGTFDLVLVVLQSDVLDILMVTEELDITDAAMLLLKPDGLIARNQDWGFATEAFPAKYSVDLFNVDVPITCYQGITMGSNTVDFFSRTPRDHGVETLYLKPVDEIGDRFSIWYNYRTKSNNRANKLCMEMGSEGGSLIKEATSGLGVLIIIEAEDVAVPLQSSSSIQSSISKALKNAGLAEVSAKLSPEMEDGYEIVLILQEGYVVARVWPEQEYCAYDLLLWSSFDKQEATKAQLIDAVGSKSTSSYRIITGGMFGVSDDKSHVGPRIKETCDEDPADTIERDATTEPSVIETVLSEVSTLIEGDNATVIVLCGKKSGPCSSLEVLKRCDAIEKAIPVWTCDSLAASTEVAPHLMLDCESDTLRSLEELDDKLSGIVIDPEAPRVMGQILHKILSNSRVRRKLLADNHVVLSVSARDPSGSVWRRALLDRFRTDFAIFDPAYRAEILFDALELGVFSSNDGTFYSHLTNVLVSVEEKTGISPDVRNIKNGVNNYVADFEPSQTFSNDDFDIASALDQWSSQDPLGKQTIFQFEATEDPEPLSTASIKEVMEDTLFRMQLDGGSNDAIDVEVYGIGDGCVIVGFWSNGSTILTWDGRTHVSVNLFSDESHARFIAIFQKKGVLALTVTARDEMPRGIGRVVNLPEDIGTTDASLHWAQ